MIHFEEDCIEMNELQRNISICSQVLSDSEAEWTSQVKSMKLLETAAIQVDEIQQERNIPMKQIVQELTALVSGFRRALGDSRPALIKQTCSLLGALAKCCGSEFIPIADLLIAPMLLMATKKNQTQVVAFAVRQCLHTISKESRYNIGILEKSFYHAKKDDTLRMICLSLAALVLRYWNPDEVLAKATYASLRRIILKGIADRDAAVQTQSRLTLCLLFEYAHEPIDELIGVVSDDILGLIANDYPDSLFATAYRRLLYPSDEPDLADEGSILSAIPEIDQEEDAESSSEDVSHLIILPKQYFHDSKPKSPGEDTTWDDRLDWSQYSDTSSTQEEPFERFGVNMNSFGQRLQFNTENTSEEPELSLTAWLELESRQSQVEELNMTHVHSDFSDSQETRTIKVSSDEEEEIEAIDHGVSQKVDDGLSVQQPIRMETTDLETHTVDITSTYSTTSSPRSSPIEVLTTLDDSQVASISTDVSLPTPLPIRLANASPRPPSANLEEPPSTSKSDSSAFPLPSPPQTVRPQNYRNKLLQVSKQVTELHDKMKMLFPSPPKSKKQPNSKGRRHSEPHMPPPSITQEDKSKESTRPTLKKEVTIHRERPVTPPRQVHAVASVNVQRLESTLDSIIDSMGTLSSKLTPDKFQFESLALKPFLMAGLPDKNVIAAPPADCLPLQKPLKKSPRDKVEQPHVKKLHDVTPPDEMSWIWDRILSMMWFASLAFAISGVWAAYESHERHAHLPNPLAMKEMVVKEYEMTASAISLQLQEIHDRMQALDREMNAAMTQLAQKPDISAMWIDWEDTYQLMSEQLRNHLASLSCTP